MLAKDRFPDVVWDLVDEDDDAKGEEVWGHKGSCFIAFRFACVEMATFWCWSHHEGIVSDGPHRVDVRRQRSFHGYP